MRHIPPIFLSSMISVFLLGFNQGNHPIKRFLHLLFFYFHKSANDAIAIVCIFALFLARESKRKKLHETLFFLLFFEYKRNFYTTQADNLTSLRSSGSISLSSVAPTGWFPFTLIALTSLRSQDQYLKFGYAILFSFHAIVPTSLRSSGSLSLSSVTPTGFFILRYSLSRRFRPQDQYL